MLEEAPKKVLIPAPPSVLGHSSSEDVHEQSFTHRAGALRRAGYFGGGAADDHVATQQHAPGSERSAATAAAQPAGGGSFNQLERPDGSSGRHPSGDGHRQRAFAGAQGRLLGPSQS